MIGMEQIHEKSTFCFMLMKQLDADIQSSKSDLLGYIANYTVYQEEIVILRRELMKLSKMLRW